MALVSIIAAVARNGVIGAGNAIPWRLPSDFAHFKRTTMGKPLVMGRRTFESIGRPLPGRTTIVVTRNAGYRADGVEVRTTLGEALERAQEIAAATDAREVFVAGGGEIYAEAMDIADRLYLTHVDAEPEGDVRFPSVDNSVWSPAEDLPISPDAADSASYRVIRYERTGPDRR